jgi:hypothetical protein
MSRARTFTTILPMLALVVTRCAMEVQSPRFSSQKESISFAYDHFKDGVLFADVEYGLEVLWHASFVGRSVYKENLGVFVPEGLLILPNTGNTPWSSKLSALPNVIRNNRLYIIYNGNHHEVLGIIHSHPDINSLPMPTPRNDYQYCYLGIHNYVMDYANLFDAYKDVRGDEAFVRLGNRNEYTRLPLVNRLMAGRHNPDGKFTPQLITKH